MTRAEFEQKVDAFFAKYDDQPLNFDGLYGNQCKDVFSAFNSEVLDHPYIYGNAVQMWDNAPDEWFEKILNLKPSDMPIKGDIPVWNANIGGGFGHIAIAKGWGNVNEFDSFDENWPSQGYYDANKNFIGTGKCHFQRHNYSNLIGWLRPRTQENPTPIPVEPAPVPIEIPTPAPVEPPLPAPAPEPIPVVVPPTAEPAQIIVPEITAPPVEPTIEPEPIVQPEPNIDTNPDHNPVATIPQKDISTTIIDFLKNADAGSGGALEGIKKWVKVFLWVSVSALANFLLQYLTGIHFHDIHLAGYLITDDTLNIAMTAFLNGTFTGIIKWLGTKTSKAKEDCGI